MCLFLHEVAAFAKSSRDLTTPATGRRRRPYGSPIVGLASRIMAEAHLRLNQLLLGNAETENMTL